jgi:hypothetical protein
MPNYVNEMLLQEFPAESDFWTEFYFESDEVENIDMIARFEIVNIEVSPETIREDVSRKTKRIQDGWEYVLDERGNVAKDSLGNDITRDVFRRVSADVIRTYQEKAALINAKVELIDAKSGSRLFSRPIYAEAEFDHVGQTFAGDERALSSSERRVIPLRSFPSNEQLLEQAVNQIKARMIKELLNDKIVS